ncbi:uncharacterized protein LOC136037219 [Artemia franciscana]|uniref:uncharacterized protein LOC136037219 n=1 Tax=Artemia franciscana TaxID=6661 RepID=UPI0032DBD7DF
MFGDQGKKTGYLLIMKKFWLLLNRVTPYLQLVTTNCLKRGKKKYLFKGVLSQVTFLDAEQIPTVVLQKTVVDTANVLTQGVKINVLTRCQLREIISTKARANQWTETLCRSVTKLNETKNKAATLMCLVFIL